MTTEELMNLRERQEQAKAAANSLRMMNTHGKTTKEMLELDIAMLKADRDWYEAFNVYRLALEEEVGRQEDEPAESSAA
jgi:hypothetical protein